MAVIFVAFSHYKGFIYIWAAWLYFRKAKRVRMFTAIIFKSIKQMFFSRMGKHALDGMNALLFVTVKLIVLWLV